MLTYEVKGNLIMKRNRSLLALVLACLMLLTAMTGCSGETEIPGIDDAQAEAILTPILDRSNELMQVFFGEGLPHETPETTLEYDGVQYENVLPESPYTSIAQMKAAMEVVFTSGYKADLCIMMFDGYETPKETQEEGEEVLDDTILPRYHEENGVLQIDIKYEAFQITAIPQAKGAKVLRGNATRVVVEVPYITKDGGSGTTRITLALDGEVWLIDGPTY